MPERRDILEHCVMGAMMLTTLLWFDLVPAAALGQCVKALALWSAFSTTLVVVLGAWVALSRRNRWPLA